MKHELRSVEDLTVYQSLCELALDVHHLTLTFPKYELFELGSQTRRSSNSAPANLAEGWGSRHIRIYLEGVTRALGELRETRHHLSMSHRKGYFDTGLLQKYLERYDECERMLLGLERYLLRRTESTERRRKRVLKSITNEDVR